MGERTFNGNELKGIAMLAMTIDHLAGVVSPGYPTDWWMIGLHMIGRLAAPIFWFFIVEGYYHTRDIRQYAMRLFAFAAVSHFAYNFAFGIPFVPFQTSPFNQTSVIWALAWGLVALAIHKSPRWKNWQKTLMILGIAAIAFCADWSCIAVLAIVQMGENRGDFKRQMTGMVLWVLAYAAVYAVFLNPVYGLLQLAVVFAIPLLKRYNGTRGSWKGMRWFFYAYYPLHLVICGLIRMALSARAGG